MSSWDQSWDTVYQQQGRDKYPSENVIRFMARNYYRVDDRKTVRVLDLGCGGGNNLWYLAREGFAAYGIDGSKTAIVRAKERLTTEGLTASMFVADLVALPFPDEYFDVAIDRQSIQHIRTKVGRQASIAEVYRVLRGGGTIPVFDGQHQFF